MMLRSAKPSLPTTSEAAASNSLPVLMEQLYVSAACLLARIPPTPLAPTRRPILSPLRPWIIDAAREDYLAAAESRAQDEREHARLHAESSDDGDASDANVPSSASGSSGAKARVKYVPFENVWPDHDDNDVAGFEAAVDALNDKCRLIERRKEHLRHDIYIGDEAARAELDKLNRESVIDPDAEIRRWKRAQRDAQLHDDNGGAANAQSVADDFAARARADGYALYAVDDPFVATLAELATAAASDGLKRYASHHSRHARVARAQSATRPNAHAMNEEPRPHPAAHDEPSRTKAVPCDESPSATTRVATHSAHRAVKPLAGWPLVSLLVNVVLITVVVVLGVQHVLHDP
eukprot:4005254-Pleurochrysis_carterae.AAC.2